MTLTTFSTILSIGAVLIFNFSLLITFENKFSFIKNIIDFKIKIINKIFSLFGLYKREKTNGDTFYLLAIAAISGGSIIGAIIYEYIYKTAPCEMCWWGRVALFPIFPIALLSLKYKITNVNKIIMLLAGIGLAIGVYHYYYHFNIYVLDNIMSMPCDASALLPACSNNNDILIFGFITMPFMGILNFLSMILIANKIRD